MPLDGGRPHPLEVDAAAVVGDGDDQVVIMPGRAHGDGRPSRLVVGAVAGVLDPVVDGVAQAVGEHVAELLDELGVDLDLAALDDEVVRGLAHLDREIEDHLRHAVEEIRERHDRQLANRRVQRGVGLLHFVRVGPCVEGAGELLDLTPHLHDPGGGHAHRRAPLSALVLRRGVVDDLLGVAEEGDDPAELRRRLRLLRLVEGAAVVAELGETVLHRVGEILDRPDPAAPRVGLEGVEAPEEAVEPIGPSLCRVGEVVRRLLAHRLALLEERRSVGQA